jgi:hypothetical protein
VHRYIEISTNGFDEASAGVSTSPFSVANPSNLGLRIPSLVPTALTTLPTSNRYLFLLATRTLSKPTTIRGIRQLLTIGASVPRTVEEATLPELPIELWVQTPNFKFTDGNVSWHLVLEPNAHRLNTVPRATDTQSFAFNESEGAALIYQTFAASMTNPATGAPVNYPVTLTSYSAPPIWGDWKPIVSDLFTFNDIRFPWNGTPSGYNVNIPIDVQGGGGQRVSLYASVLQTSASAITIPNFPNPFLESSFVGPEWQFIMTCFNNGQGVGYWRIGGSLIFLDEV